MFHPFYVKNEDGTGQWKAASNLEAGDELLTEDGKKVFVSEVRVEKLEEEITVYNLELDEVHTYYVALGVLVHNMCATKKIKKENAGGSAGEQSKRKGVNGFDTNVNNGKQGKHIVGDNNYTEGRSIFEGNVDDAQELVDEFAGTGEWIGQNKERVDFGNIIGKYVNPKTRESVDTTVGIIHYSKTGTHIVPAQPSK